MSAEHFDPFFDDRNEEFGDRSRLFALGHGPFEATFILDFHQTPEPRVLLLHHDLGGEIREGPDSFDELVEIHREILREMQDVAAGRRPIFTPKRREPPPEPPPGPYDTFIKAEIGFAELAGRPMSRILLIKGLRDSTGLSLQAARSAVEEFAVRQAGRFDWLRP